MFDKIYKEIFLKDFILKRKIHQLSDASGSVWEVKIYNASYFIFVYEDDINEILSEDEKAENKKEYEKRNEAELLQFRIGKCSTEKRITANRLFLELVRRYIKEAPYLIKFDKNNKK